ncbi:MAG TPA: YXWGXW repeat-containing protein, partial [Steroidobacteraceae bacterium]|nr:YXWGXW repeat-containing protein [Steroidobacteraceae bacterium]
MRYRSLLFAATLATALALAPASWAQIGIGVSINVAPPVLPVYTQPPIPAAGYLWVPGYWAWADGGYYWVPGTWVEPPQPGLLWTPGYWAWVNGAYVWNEGYWGLHVGFYGGVHYGFGYNGSGYVGGYWRNGAFFYNSAVNRIPAGVRITHVYRRAVPAVTVRVSFNGGAGGIQAHATAAQLTIGREQHFEPVVAQRQQEQVAGRNPALRFSANHGRPTIAATAHAGQFSGAGVIRARGAPAARENIAHHGAGPGAVRREAEQARGSQERAQPERAQ